MTCSVVIRAAAMALWLDALELGAGEAVAKRMSLEEANHLSCFVVNQCWLEEPESRCMPIRVKAKAEK